MSRAIGMRCSPVASPLYNVADLAGGDLLDRLLRESSQGSRPVCARMDRTEGP
jgi:hypothetical protein